MKKILTLLLALSLLAATLVGCATPAADTGAETRTLAATTANTSTTGSKTEVTAPKYVFLFIGDGMSYPQIQSTSDYLGALNDKDYWQAEPCLLYTSDAADEL